MVAEESGVGLKSDFFSERESQTKFRVLLTD